MSVSSRLLMAKAPTGGGGGEGITRVGITSYSGGGRFVDKPPLVEVDDLIVLVQGQTNTGLSPSTPDGFTYATSANWICNATLWFKYADGSEGDDFEINDNNGKVLICVAYRGATMGDIGVVLGEGSTGNAWPLPGVDVVDGGLVLALCVAYAGSNAVATSKTDWEVLALPAADTALYETDSFASGGTGTVTFNGSGGGICLGFMFALDPS